MPFTFIDRRKADKNKSAPNRQKLIKRVRGFVKSSTPASIGQNVGSTSTSHSPINVASSALEEPWFAYERGGTTSKVYIGNDKFDRGDEIKHQENEGDGKGGAGPGANGEDDFVVNVASNEFFDLFFEDCELPNLENEKVTDRLDTKYQPAGFSTTGIPAQLSVTRSYKQSLGRRRALLSPYRKELQELQLELAALLLAELDQIDHERCAFLEERIAGLQRKIMAYDAFDKVDLRFKKKEQKPLHTVEAVLFLAMDISGSMDEHKKKISRRWFALLFAFISKRYPGAQLRFFAHTETAWELNEAEFFSTKINGGTVVSPMLKLINTIIRDDYDPAQTNIYFSHASDGDNYESDDNAVYEELVGPDGLLSKLQFFSYVEADHNGTLYSSLPIMSAVNNKDDSELWESYAAAKDDEASAERVSMIHITNPDDCYTAFKKVFKKK